MIRWTDPRGAELDRLCAEEPEPSEAWRECRRCHDKKNPEDFYAANGSSDGLDWWCKSCRAEYGESYREKHRERLRAAYLVWRKANAARWRTYNRDYQRRKRAAAKEAQ